LKKQIAALFFQIGTFFVGYTQEIFIKKTTITEGLPSNSVFDIMQDEKEFLWFFLLIYFQIIKK